MRQDGDVNLIATRRDHPMMKHMIAAMDSKHTMLWLYAFAVSIVLGIGVASYLSGAPVSHFTRDPASVMHAHFYTGILSNLGILFWCIAATACIFGFYLEARINGETMEAFFLLYFGMLSSVLLFDDLFLLHEIASDLFFKSERFVYLIYLLIMAYGLFLFRQVILRTDRNILVASLIFFAASILFDLLPEGWSTWHHLFEDGAKFLGIVAWCNYFIRASWKILAASQSSHEQHCASKVQHDSP